LWHVYLHYFNIFKTFDFSSHSFWFAAAYVVFSVLLFIGGFVSKHTLSVISGLFLFLTAAAQLIMNGIPADPVNGLFVYFLTLATGFYFLTHGNTD
jgi:hypothetical protein